MRHHHYHHHHHFRVRHVARGVAASTPAEVQPSKYSAIVVDARTGRELWGVNVNALRHPASLTKVMTLYLLFEQLQKGNLTMASRIPFSAHAAAQQPTKLGVPAGGSISVEEAIKAIVTRSANDVAVAIAEKIGGSESNFCALMTHRAHELGMARTLYRDASGLPNDQQLTTAHDLAVLGRAMQQRFPQYFHFFSLREFTFNGQVIGNHDHLLGRIDGVDGMKTGYTNGSGFNLLTSVHRDGRALVAVVMGGISGPARDRLMTRLIETHIADASVGGATTRVADSSADDYAPPRPPRAVARVIPVRQQVADAEPARGAAPQGEGDDSEDDVAPSPPPRAVRPARADAAILAKAAALDPSQLGWRTGPTGKPLARGKAAAEESRVARADDDNGDDARQQARKGGWSIQIGATDDAAKARRLVQRAKSRNRTLALAHASTEKVRKDGDTLYRVRFAGLDSASAAKACRDLKHGGLDCFTTRD
ncbi:MAG TPA: SPOR domain-containing protein [Roseiarcus sp.]|nr:SPOR domain-containing protein [Roseiarcus sp.]